MFYEYTIRKIKTHEFNDLNNENYKYAIWMCEEILKMTNAYKAARWIGYVLKIVEDLDFWDNSISRDYIREDVRIGNDRLT